MKADVFVRILECQAPGEITTEVDARPGEPCFVPWRSMCGLRQDQVYPVAELPEGCEILVNDPRQEGRVLAAVAEHGFTVSVIVPQKRPMRRTVSVNVEDPDHRKVKQLASRDGISVAAWIRSAIRRELARRRL
ncbi:MAG: hypothetical protein AAGN66_27345 [Acidobacteriota bacterium]